MRRQGSASAADETDLVDRRGRVVSVLGVPWAAAALLWALLPAGYELGNPVSFVAVVVLVMFAQANRLRIELRKHTFTVNLGEIPFVLGLFLLPPFGLVVARTLGVSRRVLLGGNRSKALYSVGVAALECTVALQVLELVGDRPVSDPVSWAVALLATGSANVAAALMVLLAISASQGRVGWKRVGRLTGTAVSVGLLNTIVGLVALIVMDVSNWGLLLLLGVLAMTTGGYSLYARALQRHRSLGRVYEFSSLVESARGDVSAFDDALRQLRETFNATAVVLSVEPGGGQDTVILRADDAGVRDVTALTDDPLHERLAGLREGLLVSRRATPRSVSQTALDARGADEVMAIALRAGSGLIGYLEVHDRQGEVTWFTPDDVSLLQNLAAHLTAALENQQLVDRLRHEAHHDRLTGLPNRERFVLRVDEAIAAIRERADTPTGPVLGPNPGGLVAVFLLDLDSFKDINDSLGHDYGDRLLITVGERLREHAQNGAVVARMGADEFAMLTTVPTLAAAELQATELHGLLAEPYPLAGLSVHVGSCVGVAVAPDHALDGGTLLQRADVALYAAKNKGRAVAAYLPTMEQASVHRLQLVTQLREALDAGQVTVRYQPKIAMATRDLVGVEALVRWEHPQYGTVVPDDFVPLAERTGLIGPLTMHVIEAALRQCRAWLDRDLRIGVAVNLSVRNLLEVDFPDRVEELRAEIGVPPELLAFEITESSVMSDPERSMPVLHRLHELGIALSIDDFGTGYSSLAYLRRLPVDEVKIDKVFVLGMGTDLGDLAIVRAIIELGRSLGLRVVAEGVEDELARDLLQGMDCDVAQGFLVSRALTPDRLDAWFTARTVARPGQPGVRGRRLQVTA